MLPVGIGTIPGSGFPRSRSFSQSRNPWIGKLARDTSGNNETVMEAVKDRYIKKCELPHHVQINSKQHSLKAQKDEQSKTRSVCHTD
jgi:hypothetical protein